MPALLPGPDPDGLLEYSVVFTDRSLNHMSAVFQQTMRDIDGMLREVYKANATALIPGGGTAAMEAVARQFGRDSHVLIVRNGWFSYRWSQIFDAAGTAAETTVVMAEPVGNSPQPAYAPASAAEVARQIRETSPAVVFAPHVETSAGMILPDDWITEVAAAAHDVGALMVLDCIASGAVWVDMQATGVDVLISAPQKGWSAQPAAGAVMLSKAAMERLGSTQSDSFMLDLKKWREIMQAYLDGGHAYHATLPTDALVVFRDAMAETKAMGFDAARAAQWALGRRVRETLEGYGCRSVAADGYQAPGVVVSYTDRAEVKTGKAFAQQGVQIAGGVPLKVGEPEDFSTFRIGLFGLDKLKDVEGAVARLDAALSQIF